MNILVSTTLIELYQYRFPKSKKVRIRKKWRKRKENYRERDVAVQFDRDTLFVSPSLFEKLKTISSKEIDSDIQSAFNKIYWDLL